MHLLTSKCSPAVPVNTCTSSAGYSSIHATLSRGCPVAPGLPWPLSGVPENRSFLKSSSDSSYFTTKNRCRELCVAGDKLEPGCSRLGLAPSSPSCSILSLPAPALPKPSVPAPPLATSDSSSHLGHRRARGQGCSHPSHHQATAEPGVGK